MNNMNQKGKHKFNMMNKGLSRKQIVISIDINNTERIMVQLNAYIVNINRLLKSVKFEISANYIHFYNKLTTFSNLNIIEKYMKELNDVDLDNIISPRLL